MPLLLQEPCQYPDDLFAAPTSADDVQWWALHIRPRAEKTLARQLYGRRITHFLPVQERRRRYQGRVRTAYVPLFPGYLFLRGNHEDRLHALETNLVVKCLDVVDQDQLWDDLARVQRLLRSEAELTPEQRLAPGAPVEIVAGPFAGMTGKVESRRNGKLKFFVEVRLLQQGVSVEIDTWMIEPMAPNKT